MTNNPYDDFPADWSPDGMKILFHSDSSFDGSFYAYGDWYTMNVDGSGKQRIMTYDSTFGGARLRYSPDGRHIAFIWGDNNNELYNEIYIMNAHGSDRQRITNNTLKERYLSWSPDGRKITFLAESTSYPTSPNWSPLRGKGGAIYMINIDGTGLKQITSGVPRDYFPEWRPEAKSIGRR